jgi:NADH-quinone oxidoreductase subunit H
MIVFMICMVAETNRAPFDLPEAENELIAGYHTEYSSMKFAVFFMGEYAAMFIFSGVLSAIFLGGYNLLPIRWDELARDFEGASPIFNALGGLNYWLAPMWFMGKIVFMLSCFIWLRATLPRLRYDQLMSLGWKSLLPLAATNFILISAWIVVKELYGPVAGVGLWIGSAVLLFIGWGALRRYTKPTAHLESRKIRMVEPAKPPTATPIPVEGGQ